ncbi:MAG: serine hydrolase, partial [Cyclobacteriaceae bacterium]|nr:serine hydrolase [Acetobacteraceae bacterium]MBY0432959.1 serine hydrolase [Cyclobacteriaceae bacterium]
MKILFALLLPIMLALTVVAQSKKEVLNYYPGPHTQWIKKTPAESGMNPAKLSEAILFSKTHETKNPRDMEVNHYQTFGREPYGYGIGPFKERGDVTGVILRHGYIVAEWGDPHRVDMSHSITKSFLSSVVGLAVDKNLIQSVYDTVRYYVPPILPYNPILANDKATTSSNSVWITPFESAHNRKITWDHLLRQVSDWEGTLWGKPDWADRPGPKPEEWTTRIRIEPGKVYEYNDVRVNALALATLAIWRKPLPEVLKENIMDVIDASSTWRWYGYENSFVILDGKIIQSVSGGGHWGGGMIINARDMARFGYLTLRKGKWKDKQVLSENWVKMATTPTPAEPGYGFMNWFL